MKHEYDILPEEFDLIEKYLGKTLSKEETTAFEQKLQTDPVWKEKLNEVSLLMLGIKETALKEKLAGFHESITAATPLKKGTLIAREAAPEKSPATLDETDQIGRAHV